MRKVVSVAFAVIAAAGLSAVPALADGPGVGPATVVSVGDSAISGEAGRWAGNTNGSPVERRRPRLDRVLRQRGRHRRGDPRLPSLQGGRDRHRRRRGVGQPRVLGRAHLHAALQQRQRLQAGPGLLRRRRRAHRPGQGSAAVRGDPQREAGRRAHRRQRLRLRRHRPAVRDRLAHVAVVVEELLPRRLEHHLEVHRRERRRHHHARHERVPQPAHRDAQRRLRRRHRGRCSRRPTRRRCRAAPRSATRRPASRARPSAAAASGTPTPTGPTTPSSPSSTAPCATPPRPPD